MRGQLSSAEEQAEVKLISLSVFAGAEKNTECEVEAMVECAADEDMLVVELASGNLSGTRFFLGTLQTVVLEENTVGTGFSSKMF